MSAGLAPLGSRLKRLGSGQLDLTPLGSDAALLLEVFHVPASAGLVSITCLLNAVAMDALI